MSDNMNTHLHTVAQRHRQKRATFPILRQTASRMCDYLAVKPSAIGQPTWPTQPSIPQGSVNE